jgi:hypothetical protein
MAPSKRSSRVAAAMFEHLVQIWDVETGMVVNEFETVFSFGGPRLTLDPLGEEDVRVLVDCSDSRCSAL